jgi:hypothetical protein
MHLTCTNQSKEVCDAGLAGAKEAGICNIVALRGDPPKGQDRWEVTEGGFACALDLVKYMRSNYGDYFSIQVRRVVTASQAGDAPGSLHTQARQVPHTQFSSAPRRVSGRASACWQPALLLARL